MTERIQKIRRIEEQLAQLRAAQKAQERKDVTRTKILLGAAALRQLEALPEAARAGHLSALVERLGREQDRRFLLDRLAPPPPDDLDGFFVDGMASPLD